MEQVPLLRQLFSVNRAEQNRIDLDQIFVEPVYSTKLSSFRPSLLIGGRGTGKTTALQSLRYDRALDRLSKDGRSFGDLEYLGIFIRMNKNHVSAFRGNGVSEDTWGKAFHHYFNLLVCIELCDLTIWLQGVVNSEFNEESVIRVARTFGLDGMTSIKQLADSLDQLLNSLELFVNNPTRIEPPIFSAAERPLVEFVSQLEKSQLIQEQYLFCCIDEYENLLQYQQAVVNTYIKHATRPLSYKVGVRKEGLKTRSTLDQKDGLRIPDDLEMIEIAEEGFDYFATKVIETRLGYAASQGMDIPQDLSELLESIPFAREAERLGADSVRTEVLEELSENRKLYNYFKNRPDTFFLKYWQDVEGVSLQTLAESWIADPTFWERRLGNYGFASLFWLSKGRKGARIKKYYCGKTTFLSLAAGNIRYFLQLIDRSLERHIARQENSLGDKKLVISPEAQTEAVVEVGQRLFHEIEGLAENGVRLRRLLLGIGKVFFEKARAASGSPEVNSFVLSGTGSDKEKIEMLLSEGVGHLAFEVSESTKLTSVYEVRDSEYRIHRIFSGFFYISQRKKRRMTFKAEELLRLVEGDSPGRSIAALLNDEVQTSEEELPEQMALFSSFFEEH